jgi:hypothetical protein
MPTLLDNALKLRLSPQVRCEGTASSFLRLPCSLQILRVQFQLLPLHKSQLRNVYPANTTTQRDQDGGRRCTKLTDAVVYDWY